MADLLLRRCVHGVGEVASARFFGQKAGAEMKWCIWMVLALCAAHAQTPEQITRFLDWANANGMQKDAVVWPVRFVLILI